MNSKQVLGGGVLTGLVFYVVSLIVLGVFKFLPVIPLSIAVPSERLGRGWQIEHLVVSLVIGILWAVGYAIYGKSRPGGWLYGWVIYMATLLPTFAVHLIIAESGVRSGIFYGALLALIGALLGGKVVSLIVKR